MVHVQLNTAQLLKYIKNLFFLFKIKIMVFFKLKLVIETQRGELVDRICPWANYVTQCKMTNLYQQVFYNPSEVILNKK